MNYNELLKKSNYARKDVPINIEDSFEYKRNKNISDKLYLYNGGLDNVSLVGRGELSGWAHPRGNPQHHPGRNGSFEHAVAGRGGVSGAHPD